MAVEQALRSVERSIPQGTEAGAQARERLNEALARMRERNDALLSDARAEAVQPPFDPANMIPPQAVDMAYAFFATCAIIIIGFPLARAFARRMDRRGQAAATPELTPRLERMEQAIEAVAIEVERISEGQRFVTRLLSEGRGLPAGSAAVGGGAWPDREPEPVPRSAPERGRA
jgi:hypothetical protein